ncbi:MAG: S53 family peptidase [Nocardioidaceae bacterium]
MPHQRYRVLVAALAAAALAVPLLNGTAASAASGAHRFTVPNTAPVWATASHLVGAPAANQVVAIRVGLKMRNPAAAQALVADVSNPASRSYGHYLSPSAFRARFAPTRAAVDRVEGYLASQGIKVTGVAQGRVWINATGTVAQLNKAFGTMLKTYSVHGRTLRASASGATLPAALQADVSTVAGLSQYAGHRAPLHKTIARQTRPAAATHGPNATRPPASQCSNYWGQYQQTLPKAFGQTRFNTYFCGYTPAQLRKIYGTTRTVARGNNGKGVTVAILDAYGSPTMLSDANQYAATMGEPQFAPGQYSQKLFKPFNEQNVCGGETGWNEEQALDVEAVHAMAPGANIHYIGAQNCDQGLDSALNYVIQNHVADIVSNSYGWVGEAVPADEVALEHSLFLQAGAEGIGLYFSSGDSGDNVINGLTPQPDFESSDPLVTGVGGTSEFINKHGRRINTTGWETELNLVDYSGAKAVYTGNFFYAGAGGGTSTLFSEPWYQKGTVPNSLANRDGQRMRVAPDISADADPYTGFYFGLTESGQFGIGTIGGTSLACPLVAGMQALAEQHRKFPIGFANPLLYSLRNRAFLDVHPQRPIHFASVAGSYLGTFEAGDTQTTRWGYDNITGRGTPNGTTFLRAERN